MRSLKEKQDAASEASAKTVSEILAVIDNFERGLAAVAEDKAEDSFVTGMQMTYKQLLKALEDAGIPCPSVSINVVDFDYTGMKAKYNISEKSISVWKKVSRHP